MFGCLKQVNMYYFTGEHCPLKHRWWQRLYSTQEYFMPFPEGAHLHGPGLASFMTSWPQWSILGQASYWDAECSEPVSSLYEGSHNSPCSAFVLFSIQGSDRPLSIANLLKPTVGLPEPTDDAKWAVRWHWGIKEEYFSPLLGPVVA